MTVADALPTAAAGKPIEVWFQDEARVGQQGTLTRLWARRASRPRAVRDTRYQWAYIFGAVCPRAALVMPYADTEAMNAHVTENAHAVLVLDGAGWHGGAALDTPENITLVVRSPYSPELNPVENVWEYLRKNKLANPALRNLRGYPRRLLHRLERPHGRPWPHHFDRRPRLGQHVMNYVGWYLASGPIWTKN